MEAHVFGLGKNFEVRDVIVEAVSVSMVNDLALSKCPSEMRLHDHAMLGPELSAYADVTVSKRLVDVPTLEPRMLRAKVVPCLDAVRQAFRLPLPRLLRKGLEAKRLVFRNRHLVAGDKVGAADRFHFLTAELALHRPILAPNNITVYGGH